MLVVLLVLGRETTTSVVPTADAVSRRPASLSKEKRRWPTNSNRVVVTAGTLQLLHVEAYQILTQIQHPKGWPFS
jgi:hypothetical protein